MNIEQKNTLNATASAVTFELQSIRLFCQKCKKDHADGFVLCTDCSGPLSRPSVVVHSVPYTIASGACSGVVPLNIVPTPYYVPLPATSEMEPKCRYCGDSFYHPKSICPLIKSIEYFDSGVIKKVTLER